MMCDCITLMNNALAAHNVMLDMPFRLDFSTGSGQFLPLRAAISLMKIEKKRGSIPCLLAKFCPFCGEKYPGPEEASP